MKSVEIYKRFLLKINRNDSNEGTNFLKSHFVILFNIESDKYVIERLNDSGDTINLDDLDSLLVPDVQLTKLTTKNNWIEFKLPDNFRRHASSYSLADKDDCTGIKLYNFDKKSLTLTSILADKFSGPSFEFEEVPFIITDNKMRIYFDSFVIKKCFSTYYKAPDKIDIEGYTDFDGNPSTNIDSSLPDVIIDDILNRMAVEVRRQSKDSEGFQFDKERVNSEK